MTEQEKTYTADKNPQIEKDDNCGQPHFAYFSNKKCEYFPCHNMGERDFFNCLFCYCPLYALGDKCGGNFKYIEGQIKDCSDCTIPHGEIGYAYINRKYPMLMELAKGENREKKQ